ncbi:hypothetical protein E4582_13430 [Luteimonas yindakuii]|uniref:Uncharacterized protein n=1 Tax=Luteimonas yindakuii TaxID=2565782 RepID=A0A4Z1R931_9GAMM|nr:hypothetical protein E4582_13430 [Luteimonas yindakuii]
MPDSALNPGPVVRAALALELGDVRVRGPDALAQADAGALGERIARDLAGFAPAAATLDLITVGAHYDPVELLRPGWPLHREIDQLAARAPGEAGGRVIAFGAHEGRLPGALAPAREHAGGPLRLVPLLLRGDAATTTAVADVFERDLMETGMAGAETALHAQEAFGLVIEHARYLTAHDLLAMTALQYEHAGIAPLWPVLETALLSPTDEAWLDAGPEPLVHYTGGEARIALFSPAAWRARYAAGEADEARLQHGWMHFEARQRQFDAVLRAHAIPVRFDHCPDDADPRSVIG